MSDELVLTIDPPYIGSAVSPAVDITETDTTYTVDITDFRGVHSYTVEKTDQAIADAETAATNANTAAANATSTANAAAQYARDTADQAAADAQETADAAAGRADTAAASATQAAQSANTAAGTANTAAANADAKAALADSKAALANTAATSANQAAQAAEAAKTAANTAAGQATTAAGNANTAAGQANTAATNADAKAALADTAATNADTATQAANTATTNATNAAQAANNAADYAIEAADDMPKLIATVDSVQAVADAYPTTMHGATVYGKSVQDGTPTPDNPVPVQVVGGNTFPLTGGALNDGGTIVAGGVTFTRDNNMITANGTSTSTYPQAWLVAWSEWLTPGRTYTLSKSVSNIPAGAKFYVVIYENDTPDSTGQRTVASLTNRDSVTFAPTKPYTHAIVVAEGNGVTWDGAKIGVTLMEGSTASPYVPYGCIGLQVGETVTPIDLQGHTLASLPDGTRDVLRVDSAGSVTIEQHVSSVDLGALNWLTGSTTASGIVRMMSNGIISTVKKPGSDSQVANVICDAYTAKTAGQTYQRIAGLAIDGAGSISIYNENYNTASSTAAFKAAMSGVMLYYELAEPQTIELGTIELPELTNPCELAIYASLDPEWAIEYEQDPNIVVNALQSSIAPVEGSTASTNYAVNSYLIHANQLYRVTSAIATGEAITPGSNCVECTVMGEVIRLTA